MSGPLHLKTLIPDQVRLTLERDARLLVPVGTCEQHGPHLPLGCDTLIVERLADDLSADFQILRAPTVEYGVNRVNRREFPGNAAVRRTILLGEKSPPTHGGHAGSRIAVLRGA